MYPGGYPRCGTWVGIPVVVPGWVSPLWYTGGYPMGVAQTGIPQGVLWHNVVYHRVYYGHSGVYLRVLFPGGLYSQYDIP